MEARILEIETTFSLPPVSRGNCFDRVAKGFWKE